RETVKATRAGLAQYGNEITAEQRSAIEEALQRVSSLLASADSEMSSADSLRRSQDQQQLTGPLSPLPRGEEGQGEAAFGGPAAHPANLSVQKLKNEHAILDEATKPLAELMMDKAMEAMLQKRGLI